MDHGDHTKFLLLSMVLDSVPHVTSRLAADINQYHSGCGSQNSILPECRNDDSRQYKSAVNGET